MNETEAMKQESASNFEAGKTHAEQATNEFRDAAKEKASELRSAVVEKAKEYRTQAEGTYQKVAGRAHSIQEESEAYVRENPLRGMFTALGVGFVIGFLFRR